MSRLIDADALMEEVNIEIREYMLTEKGMRSLIRNAPTIDAVEVVRCRYCKWADKCSRNVAMRETYEMYEEIYFCSYGERKESE